MERKNCYVSSTINTASEGYKQSSRTVQNESGKMFIETEVQPQAGDTILDLGCGTGELSAYLAQLVGNSGKVVGVDPDKERLELAKKSHSNIDNLSFIEGSSSNFPGMGSESYDIIFSNYVLHWIPDKSNAFRNMYASLKRNGHAKIAAQYVSYLFPFMTSAFKELNPENAEHLLDMFNFEARSTIEQYCSAAGFDIVKSYDVQIAKYVFESIEALLKWLWSTTHGAFDPSLVTEDRLQNYYPYSSRNGQPPFYFSGIEEESTICRLVANKQVSKNTTKRLFTYTNINCLFEDERIMCMSGNLRRKLRNYSSRV